MLYASKPIAARRSANRASGSARLHDLLYK
jgi:hypothetical protein